MESVPPSPKLRRIKEMINIELKKLKEQVTKIINETPARRFAETSRNEPIPTAKTSGCIS